VESNIINLNSYTKGSSNIRGDFLISTNNPVDCYIKEVNITDIFEFVSKEVDPECNKVIGSNNNNNKIPTFFCPYYCLATQPWILNDGNLPSSINFYGKNLLLNGISYGDTENGVIPEGSVWAVYENGVRTEQSTLYSQTTGANPRYISDYFVSIHRLYINSSVFGQGKINLTRGDGFCSWSGRGYLEGGGGLANRFWFFGLFNFSDCTTEGIGWTLIGVSPNPDGPFGFSLGGEKLSEEGIPIGQGTPVGVYNNLTDAIYISDTLQEQFDANNPLAIIV
jgi:hypothetical protein